MMSGIPYAGGKFGVVAGHQVGPEEQDGGAESKKTPLKVTKLKKQNKNN